VGGLLVALAGLGTLVAWRQAAGAPDQAWAVAARAVAPGEVVGPDDVRLVPIDLPGPVAGAAFVSGDEVAGRVALGPIGEGELLQIGQLSDVGAAVPTAEVAFALERDRAVDGRLRSGDLVDVFVTTDTGTAAVAEGVEVVTVTDGGDGAFAAGAELTVTLALTDPGDRVDLVQAVRAGEVTLVRSTHLTREATPAPASDPASPAAGARQGPAGIDAGTNDPLDGSGTTSGAGAGAGEPDGTSGADGVGGTDDADGSGGTGSTDEIGGTAGTGGTDEIDGTGGTGTTGGAEDAEAADPDGDEP
jgi:hypothetical protein